MAKYTKYDGTPIEVGAQTELVYTRWISLIGEFARFRNSGRFPFGLMGYIFVGATSLALMQGLNVS